MNNYFKKRIYLLRRQKGCCPIANAKGQWAKPAEIHHRLSNSKVNKKLYPLFIDSVWNLYCVNWDWHMMYPSFGKITVLEASKREKFLQRHIKIAKYLNMNYEDGLPGLNN